MRLEQAIDYHSVVPLAGLAADGITWVDDISVGGFLTFDRFITERSFGQKKRLFQAGSKGIIPAIYHVVRGPDGRVYMVTAHNVDIGDHLLPSVYNNVYLLQEAPYTAEIIDFVVTPAASGIGGEKAENVLSTVYCDMERLSSTRSTEFDAIEYTNTILTFPFGTQLDADKELRINGEFYDIKESWPSMKSIVAKAVKRSTSV